MSGRELRGLAAAVSPASCTWGGGAAGVGGARLARLAWGPPRSGALPCLASPLSRSECFSGNPVTKNAIRSKKTQSGQN